MKINNVKVELSDEESRLVVKRIMTNEGDFLNRKIAVSNSIYNCERKRLNYGKNIPNSLFQTQHIRWDKKEKEWDFLGIEQAKKHAENNKRIFIPYKQRNQEQINQLKWSDTKKDFKEMMERFDVDNVLLPIPLKTKLDDYKKREKDFSSVLDKTQKLVPIFSSKHHIEHFPKIIKYAFDNQILIGIKGYEFSGVIERTNLAILRMINSKVKVGQEVPLIFYFDYPRILTRQSYVSGAFAYNCFSGDVFSETAHFIKDMSPKAIEEMMNKKPEDFCFYDPKQKKFNKSLPQKDWYGLDLTREFMSNVSVDGGLDGYRSVTLGNYLLQQKDLDMINEILINKEDIMEYMKDYSGWDVFWKNVVEPSITIQRTLSGF